jgi:caffeoyl-CoA O-methyltransferase
MPLIHPGIERYLDELSPTGDSVQLEMERLAAERGFPIVGPQVGRLLLVLARACGARRVLELGSGFGYSALWFARAVGAGGEVILTEGSPDRAEEARSFLGRAGLLDRCRIETGDALEIAARLGGGFDVVFNDVDKELYPRVLPLAAGALRPGGLFLSDNMLWRGQVLLDASPDPQTRGVVELTRALYASAEFDAALIPLRDGVTVAVRRGGEER